MSSCSKDCLYAAGMLADILCEFCEIPLCQKCMSSNAFGSCCVFCNRDVQTGVIDDNGFRETCVAELEEFKCGGQIKDSMEDDS